MKSRRVEATRSTCAHRGDTGVHQAEPTGGNEEAQRPHEQLGSWARCSSRPCRTRILAAGDCHRAARHRGRPARSSIKLRRLRANAYEAT